MDAQTIFCLNNAKDPRKYCSSTFAWNLSMALIMPLMMSRGRNGLKSAVLQKMQMFLPAVGQPEQEDQLEQQPANAMFSFSSMGKGRRCRMCMDNAKGEDQKNKKNALGRTGVQCQKCSEAVCTIHHLTVCKACTQGLRDPGVQVIR